MPYKDPEKQKAFKKAWQKRNVLWLRDLKDLLGCNRCGISHPAVIHFHHQDGTIKLGNVSRMINENAGLLKTIEEILKCEPLCANCHAIEHYPYA